VPERITCARASSKLPVVLSPDEVVRVLEAVPSLNSRTALTTVYAAGLRVSEVVLLKITNTDSQGILIRVEACAQRLARRLPFSQCGRGFEQAGDGAHPATLICYPPIGKRSGRAHHPGPARPRQPCEHGALHRVAAKTISNTPSPLDRLRLEVVPSG
jgi:hypothetical protein